MGFSRRPFRIAELADKFRKAGLNGFSIMRVTGSMIILMFDDEDKRQEVLRAGVLDEWIENLGIWIPSMPIPNRRTWLSVSGIPIHAWSGKTFSNIVKMWGEIASVDIETLAPSTFERARFQIETDLSYHIDETLDLLVGDQCFPIRVTEIEEAIGPKCDCCCELIEGSQISGEQDDNEEIVELKESSAVKSASPVSRETFVPDSIQSHALKSMEMERMCEGNKKVDLRVRDTAGWMAEEDIGIIERGEEQRCNAMDLSVECDFSEERQAIPDDKSVATSPINRGPQGRAKLADVIEYGGQQRKVRQISKIVMTDSSLVRVETNNGGCVIARRGDFNMVRCVDERRGCVIARRGISDFCDFVEAAALSDVPLQGKLFTWFGSGNKCSRLDRFLVSNDWFQRFDSLVVINLPRELSDHLPIMLVSDVCDSGPKPFRFFMCG
ncbi:hypothetical protein V6N11_033794 [Hibiscus sabdariffa]|uniref:DUF4283 domain-containing protein n=1 Tax=Hibiscus sabdariffa TaxID=183260 RepID=A0ABR2S0L4_9ROSI